MQGEYLGVPGERAAPHHGEPELVEPVGDGLPLQLDPRRQELTALVQAVDVQEETPFGRSGPAIVVLEEHDTAGPVAVEDGSAGDEDPSLRKPRYLN